MKIALRPSTPADVMALLGRPPAYRARLITILADDQPIAVGGIIFRPDGYWASAQITDAARKVPLALHRAGKRVFAEALARGYRPIYATPDATQPRAQAWLERLGFKRSDSVIDGKPVLVLE
jgi:hypothetical protein